MLEGKIPLGLKTKPKQTLGCLAGKITLILKEENLFLWGVSFWFRRGYSSVHSHLLSWSEFGCLQNGTCVEAEEKWERGRTASGRSDQDGRTTLLLTS